MSAADIDETTLRLLTILNAVGSKRLRDNPDAIVPSEKPPKLNKRKVAIADPNHTTPTTKEISAEEKTPNDERVDDHLDDDVVDYSDDTYTVRFGNQPTILSETSRSAVGQNKWTEKTVPGSRFGALLEVLPGAQESPQPSKTIVMNKLKPSFEKLGSKLTPSHKATQAELWNYISSYQDMFLTKSTVDTSPIFREAVTLHALNHVHKIRRTVLKTNERIAKAPASSPPDDIQDQGFTRPSVLVILPFRSFAVRWLNSFTSHIEGIQIENHSRFTSEFGLPPGTIDKTTSAEPGTYPPDHIHMFQGNVDDDFRIGIKITRKSVKLFSEFYSSDIILGSPFGLRRAIENDGNADFLSSIEILVIDQVDALAMQNWDHLKLVLSNINSLPKEGHETDFSRVKPWYLDGHAKYLRQSIMMSPFESPEMRAIFRSWTNLSGKLRTKSPWPALAVPEGVRSNFVPFESSSPQMDPDQRFQYFTTQMFPSIMKSAVQSSGTIIYVPSFHDFVRLRHWFRSLSGTSVAVMFEESTNSEISRARTAFFKGEKSFLLTTERFHFFRRYRIRGTRNVVFYAPPDHPQYYTEFLSFPFLDEGVDGSDVTCRVLYSKWDSLRLERIVGSDKVVNLLAQT